MERMMIVYEEFHFGKEKHIAFYHPVDFSLFAHLHRSYELLYLKRGRLEITVDGRSFSMKAGGSRRSSPAFWRSFLLCCFCRPGA